MALSAFRRQAFAAPYRLAAKLAPMHKVRGVGGLDYCREGSRRHVALTLTCRIPHDTSAEKIYMSTLRILRLPDVMTRTGLSRSSVYSLDSFPKPIKLGRNMSGWLESEVESWIEQRIKLRDDAEAISAMR